MIKNYNDFLNTHINESYKLGYFFGNDKETATEQDNKMENLTGMQSKQFVDFIIKETKLKQYFDFDKIDVRCQDNALSMTVYNTKIPKKYSYLGVITDFYFNVKENKKLGKYEIVNVGNVKVSGTNDSSREWFDENIKKGNIDDFKRELTNVLEKLVPTLNKNSQNGEYAKLVKSAGLGSTDGIKKIEVIKYTDYSGKSDVSEFWEGTLEEIFGKYTDANDRLKYINGSGYKFASKKVQDLYSYFVDKNGGANYLISRAAARGATID